MAFRTAASFQAACHTSSTDMASASSLRLDWWISISAKNGETDGFDFWRLARFAGDRLSQYTFTSKEELRECFQLAVDSGAFESSTYMLHYLRK